ncbi:MAG: hypothetical protein ACREL5_05100 [Gemmatimonadales bacterium]
MIRWLAVTLVPAALAAQAPDTVRVRQLVDSGRLAEAESAARAGGATTAVLLGDVLVMRGQLEAADSVYRGAIGQQAPRYRSALAGRAELASRRGERDSAVAMATQVIDAYSHDAATWRPRDLVAAGRAFAVLGRWDPQAFHDALRAFDAATAGDSADIDAQIRAADLLLDKYNMPDARESYRAVLRRVPDQPRALLGLARADAFEGNPEATDAVRRSLARDPTLTPALVLLAQLHLGADAFDSAGADAGRALAVDSTSVEAWAILGAIAWMRGDSTTLHRARAAAAAAEPHGATFLSELSDAAARERRYAEAIVLARQAVATDSTSARAFGALGENELRTGEIVRGRADLDRSFTLDPYNLWHKNTLDLLDAQQKFTTVATDRFQFVAAPDEAAYLALYLGPLLDSAYDALAARYQYRPPAPIRIEVYGRHADFSVRTTGLTGLDALGVSFGPVILLDSPRARDVGELNYGSTALHELTHTFTLGRSKFRMPRWFSEGLSVLEERRAGHGWGESVSPEFIATFKGGALPAATEINEGMVRPDFPAEIGLAYYQASLVCEMIETQHGIAAIRAMLDGWGGGLDTPAVLASVLHTTPAEFDQQFDAWVRARYAGPLAAIDSSDGRHPLAGQYVTLVDSGTRMLNSGAADSGRALLERAEGIFPEDGSTDGPAWLLAQYYKGIGRLDSAGAELRTVTMHDETALDANQLDATVRLERGDSAGALDALERCQWIAPYDAALHARTADLAEKLGQMATAVRERRAVVDLFPADSLEARYQLARTLYRAGDTAAARREILDVLEQAPAFEKAQTLLLQLQGSPP